MLVVGPFEGADLQPLGGAPAHLSLAPDVERAGAAHEAQIGPEVPAPRIERAWPAPQPQKNVLHHVLRQRGVVQDAERGGVDLAVVLREGLPKRLGIV